MRAVGGGGGGGENQLKLGEIGSTRRQLPTINIFILATSYKLSDFWEFFFQNILESLSEAHWDIFRQVSMRFGECIWNFLNKIDRIFQRRKGDSPKVKSVSLTSNLKA